MISFKKYYTESIIQEAAVDDTLKKHLSHMEDLAIEEGKKGFNKFVEQVENFTSLLEGFNSKTTVNFKIDGAPALFWGIDETQNPETGEYNNQFFISTKSFKRVHSEQEADEIYKEAPGLREVIRTVFPYLKNGYDNSGLTYQGDLLFSPARPPTVKDLGGKQCLTFQPNLITYAIPVDPASELYNIASKAPVGIVVHAAFNAAGQMQSRDTARVVYSLKKAGVFAEGSNIKSLNIQIDPNLKNTLHGLLNDAKRQVSTVDNAFDAEYSTGGFITTKLKEYLNYMVRETGGIFKAAEQGESFDINKFLNGFYTFVNNKLVTKAATGSARVQANARTKSEDIKKYLIEHKKDFAGLIGATYDMLRIKLIFQHLLANTEHKLNGMLSYIPVGDEWIYAPEGEGKVLYIGDTPNQVKIVNRSKFSKLNFSYSGERGRKPATVTEEGPATEQEAQSIGFFGGGFNPPHIGHFNTALEAAKQNNDLYIVVSRKDRDNTGIDINKKLALWKLFVPLLERNKAKIHIVEADVSPIATIYGYVNDINQSPLANEITVKAYVGQDPVDMKAYERLNHNSYPNVGKIEIVPIPRSASGTDFRNLLAAGDIKSVMNLIPQGVDKSMYLKILTGQ